MADEHTAFFVISDDAVSFGKLARFFRDGLHCPNALFLDGSVSSLWDPAAERQDAYSELGPMVLVLKRGPSPGKRRPGVSQGSMEEEPKQKNDRDRNADQPKQNTLAHLTHSSNSFVSAITL